MNRPFICKPVGKDYIWGGRRLRDDWEKEGKFPHLAESWECSTHPDGLSAAASGEFAGMELREILRLHPEYLGSHVQDNRKDAGGGGNAGGVGDAGDGENAGGRKNVRDGGNAGGREFAEDGENAGRENGLGSAECADDGQIPIIVKFIDAKQDLSVQVHPTDEYAGKFENGQQGKTELWYVVDAVEDAHVIYGLKHKTDKETLREAVEGGGLDKYLRRIPVKKNQVFFVEAGMIHAVGAGCLIAEIQENSNLTYRLYDYDRADKNGEKRQLHIEKALDAADLTAAKEPRQPMRVLNYTPGCARELLGRCRYFEVHRMLVNTERRQIVTYRADEMSFRVLLCIDGCGTLYFADTVLEVYRGDCIFVPADSVDIRIHGKLEFLDMRC